MKVLPMNDELFTQRRRVMSFLYEARELLKIDLPRIKVRIVDFEDEISVLGKCFINKDYITISKELSGWDDSYLRHVVWHELAHAYFNAPHDENCPLMSPVIRSAQSKSSLVKAFKACQSRSKTKKVKVQNLRAS